MNDQRGYRIAERRPERIVIVRALGGLGDVLCAIPAITALRLAVPEAVISYIGLPQTERVVTRYAGLIDEFVAFPGFPGVVELLFEPSELAAFLVRWRARAAPDLALQMHGSGSVSNVFTALLGAQATAGYYIPGLWCPDRSTHLPFPVALDEIRRWTHLVENLGCQGPCFIPFPVCDEDRAALAALDRGLDGKQLAIVHPGASSPSRRWCPQSFARVADMLAARGLTVVLTGTADEAPVVAAVATAMSAQPVDMCGRTSLGVLGALTEAARLVVTNDTGMAHLAGALRTPSVTVFIESDPARWAPYDRTLHSVVGQGIADPIMAANDTGETRTAPTLDDVATATENLLANVR